MTAAEGHPEVIIEGRFYRQQVECGPPPLEVGQQRAFLVTEAGDHFTMLTERSMPPAAPPPVHKASGCAGCSTSEPGWLLVLAVTALRGRRRRRRG